MAKLTVKKAASIVYSKTVWEGIIEYDGKDFGYRYAEDENGSELFIHKGDHNWITEHPVKDLLQEAIWEHENPEGFGSDNESFEIDH